MREWEAAGERAIVTALDILQDQYYSQLEAARDARRQEG